MADLQFRSLILTKRSQSGSWDDSQQNGPDRHVPVHQPPRQMDVLDLRAHQPINHQHLQDLRQLAGKAATRGRSKQRHHVPEPG